MRLAVLFDNLGPYHIARLEALAQRCELLAIEQRAASIEYAWEATPEVAFRRTTLFGQSEGRRKVSPGAIRRGGVRTLSDFAPDAVAVPGWATPLATSAVAWAGARNAPAILMSDTQEIDFPRTPIREWIKRRFVGNCDGAIVGGTPHREYLVKLGMDASRIRLGYDVVDNDYFRNGAARVRANAVAIREQRRLPQRYFLTSARFIEKKNLPRLIQAFAGFLAALEREGRTDAWHLVVLGDGSLRPQLESLVASLGLGERVLMPGFVQYPELPVWYGLAEAFVLASTTEQWGLVVNEAMASGLPVLVSNRCGCAPDLVRPGVNGHTFDPLDVASLTDLLLSLARAPDSRRAMGEASETLIDAWSPRVFAENLLSLSDDLVALRARRRTLADRLVLKAMLVRREIGFR